MEDYEEEEEVNISLKDNEKMDENGNIVDKTTGRILKNQDEIYQDLVK